MRTLSALLVLSTGLAFGQAYPVTANRVVTGAGAPSSTKCTKTLVGSVYAKNNAAAANSTFYVCANTAANTYTWELVSGNGGGGSGTVTTVSVTTANGVSGTVANATSTPAITLALGAIVPTSVATGSSPPAVTVGTGGGFFCTEGTGPSSGFAVAGVDGFYCDSTTHKILSDFNAAGVFALTQTVCSVSKALQTSAITSASLANDTVTCTGLATTDTVSCSFNGAVTAVTGYVPSTNGMLAVYAYPTANTINITAINNTSASITPGAVTVNCRAER